MIVLVPFLKYPSNPPAVGADETIGYRTQIYFVMIAISSSPRSPRCASAATPSSASAPGTACCVAVGAYLVLIAIAQLLMPSLNEIPPDFPADVIWHFRVATLGTHAVLYATLGLGFGAARRALAHAGTRRRSRYVSNIQPFRWRASAPDAHDLVARPRPARRTSRISSGVPR